MKALNKLADNKLVIEKVKSNKTLKELFKNYKGKYRGEEISFGEPKGKEILKEK